MWAAVTQRILSEREDGHSKEGLPGDCFKCCVATILGLPYREVPHFALHLNWWNYLRRWSREKYDLDWACFSMIGDRTVWDVINVDQSNGSETNLYIGTGPSPRGPYRHCVVVNEDLKTVWDPQPERKGLNRVDEVYICTFPYLPGPHQLQLT